jgi:hypothetical protein
VQAMVTKHKKVRVKGTDIEGTMAFRSSPFEYHETSRNFNTPVAAVYFETTGEVRYFDKAFLEDAEPSA